MLADRVGIIDCGRLLSLQRPAELKRRYGAATMEEAFFAATGSDLADDTDEDDEDDEDDERDVFG
jgi:ABC-2 type transport system ATP-binding protein